MLQAWAGRPSVYLTLQLQFYWRPVFFKQGFWFISFDKHKYFPITTTPFYTSNKFFRDWFTSPLWKPSIYSRPDTNHEYMVLGKKCQEKKSDAKKVAHGWCSASQSILYQVRYHLQGKKLTLVLGCQSGQYPWIPSGPGQNKLAHKFSLLTKKIFKTIFMWKNTPQLLPLTNETEVKSKSIISSSVEWVQFADVHVCKHTG